MPWTSAQHRLFEAAAHNPAIAKEHSMSQEKAKQMAGEGVKTKAHKLAKELMKK